jgi:membrane-bound metal-dependent hydrolase YbcI (DUF457 family)
MPDWITHLSFGWLVGRSCLKNNLSLVLLGAILPDLFTKWVLIFNRFWEPDLVNSLAISHKPVGAFLLVLLLSMLFKDEVEARKLLLLGVLTHFFLDSFMVGGVELFWPIFTYKIGLRIFWQEDVFPFIFLNSIVLVYIIILKLSKRQILG